ncbi:MAG: biopolymer transporter ExbD [Paramuribaculum sp.]|nr:biopolymer transporter ExbD [Paramuribaculum sp.]MDE6488186.1 biopolymer transporter ExbD [Paramuribaculum sp.]
MEMQASHNNRSTSVISWIGFGLAITVFLLIWFVNILVFNWMGEDAIHITALYMLVILPGGILGVMALIFSIVGLTMAIKNNTPRWIGTTGIIMCVLSILSFFVPIVCAGMMENKTMEIENTEPIRLSDEAITEDVTIQIFSISRVRCINNKNSSSTVVGNMSTYDYDFDKQLSNWLKMNKVDSTTGIIVNSTKDADYSDITKVIDTLNKNGISKFKLSSSLSDSDYFRK